MPKPIIRTENSTDFTVEESENGFIVRFRSVVFNVESHPMPSKSGNFIEIITREAFDSATKTDIRALFNHDPNKVMGRYREGATNNTMTFEVDETGVNVRCELPKTTWADDLVKSIERGDISGCSFRFWAAASDYKWVRDATRNIMIGTLTNCRKIDDFSVVTYPAYEQTENSVTIRSLAEFVESETPPTNELTPEQVRSKIQLRRLQFASI
jgi:HK97 family phage prohead protease